MADLLTATEVAASNDDLPVETGNLTGGAEGFTKSADTPSSDAVELGDVADTCGTGSGGRSLAANCTGDGPGGTGPPA